MSGVFCDTDTQLTKLLWLERQMTNVRGLLGHRQLTKLLMTTNVRGLLWHRYSVNKAIDDDVTIFLYFIHLIFHDIYLNISERFNNWFIKLMFYRIQVYVIKYLLWSQSLFFLITFYNPYCLHMFVWKTSLVTY